MKSIIHVDASHVCTGGSDILNLKRKMTVLSETSFLLLGPTSSEPLPLLSVVHKNSTVFHIVVVPGFLDLREKELL